MDDRGPGGRWRCGLVLIAALVLPAAPALAAAPPSILRTRANHVTTSSATLQVKFDTGGLATSYRVILVDPCPEPEECIDDARVGEGVLRAAAHPRGVKLALAKPNPPFMEAGVDYEYWVWATNAAGEAFASGSFKLKG
jgi:hypothetical protein